MADGTVLLREATAADAPFLELMLLEAASWSPDRQLSLDELRAAPELAHYVAGWPRPGDLGLVATASGGVPVGAVWLRTFSAEDPGFGYVRSDVPELSIAVSRQWRGRGVGRRLLRAQAEQARSRGIAMLSLSVERANPAARLYRSEGWQVVSSGRDSDTMVLYPAGARLS
jgi:GNAT superfamily N-acetyltransferase